MPFDASDNVDSLIAFMLTRYGSAWDRKYDLVAPAEVRDDWARALQGLPNFRIRFALENLPTDYPPNVMQFKALCNAAPKPVDPEAPRVGYRATLNREGLRRLSAMLARIVTLQRTRDKRQWADDLRALPASQLSPGQLAALRNLDAAPPPEAEVDGVRLERLKAETARRVRAYQKEHPETRG